MAASRVCCCKARLDGAIRPGNRRREKVRRLQHLDHVDWNAELLRGDLDAAVRELKQQRGRGLLAGGVKLPFALAELGLIDEYEFVVHPRLAGHGPALFAGLSKRIDLRPISRVEFGSGAVAMRYEPRR